MIPADSLGLIAGAISSCSLVPQVIRVFKLKSAREISFLYTTLFLVGLIMWLFYGIAKNLVPVTLWNAVAVALASGLLVAKLKYGRDVKKKTIST